MPTATDGSGLVTLATFFAKVNEHLLEWLDLFMIYQNSLAVVPGCLHLTQCQLLPSMLMGMGTLSFALFFVFRLHLLVHRFCRNVIRH